MQSTKSSFKRLIEIMKKLRSPNGCPWDKEQTADTIKGHLIEEAYEVVEAINDNDYEGLKEELGDLLLQVVFHAQIASEEQRFDLNDVIEAINEKLIRRHPHIFAGKKVEGTKDVLRQWEEIKKDEKKKQGKIKNPSYLDGVPKGLPALAYSQRLQTKASRVGFDWDNTKDVMEKLDEEILEFKQAVKEKGFSSTEKEAGDILFTIVNIARKLNIDSESALIKASNVFSKRFKDMEKSARNTGEDFVKLSLDEKERLWKEAKIRVESGEVES